MDLPNGGAWDLVGEFIEVKSGKKSDRPQLARAIDACRKHKARLVSLIGFREHETAVVIQPRPRA